MDPPCASWAEVMEEDLEEVAAQKAADKLAEQKAPEELAAKQEAEELAAKKAADELASKKAAEELTAKKTAASATIQLHYPSLLDEQDEVLDMPTIFERRIRPEVLQPSPQEPKQRTSPTNSDERRTARFHVMQDQKPLGVSPTFDAVPDASSAEDAPDSAEASQQDDQVEPEKPKKEKSKHPKAKDDTHSANRTYIEEIRKATDDWDKDAPELPRNERRSNVALIAAAEKAAIARRIREERINEVDEDLIRTDLDGATTPKEPTYLDQLAGNYVPEEEVKPKWAKQLASLGIKFTKKDTSVLEDMMAEEEEYELKEEAKKQKDADEKAAAMKQFAKELNKACDRGFPHLNPVKALDVLINLCFKNGRQYASHIYRCLRDQLNAEDWREEVPIFITKDPLITTEDIRDGDDLWNNHITATCFVMTLAARVEKVVWSCNFARTAMPQGAHTLQYIEEKENESLLKVYKVAKQSAQMSKMPDWTVIGVAMIDMEWERLRFSGQAKNSTPLSHSFVMVVGPPGITIYQAWRICRPTIDNGYDGCDDQTCEHSLSLDEWIRDRAGVRNWVEADEFVDDIERLVTRKGVIEFEDKKYKQIARLWERCFGVDLIRVCRQDGPHRPLVGKVDIKTRTMVQLKFREEDVGKYSWK